MSDAWTKIIRPKKTLSLDDAREVWAYRELLYFFAWRDIKVRYKQTVIGVLWAIFQPFIVMVVFSVFFGKLAGIPSGDIPYPIFVYAGLLFWQLFAGTLSDTSNALTGNASIITKVYFPRIILPLANTLTKLVDFGISSVILIGLMFYYGYAPSIHGLLLVPVLVSITVLSAIGGGLVLSSINVKYRDVRYVLPFFIQLLLFVTPVIYPATIAGEYTKLLWLNPMSGVIENARAGLLGVAPVDYASLGIAVIITIVFCIIGTVTFKKTERYFADVI